MALLFSRVVTVGVILNVVIIKLTIVICIMRDVTGDDLIEVLGVVTGI